MTSPAPIAELTTKQKVWALAGLCRRDKPRERRLFASLVDQSGDDPLDCAGSDRDDHVWRRRGMTETRQPVWPLVLMFLWYALLLVGIGFAGLIVLSFGSEAYRTAGIPAHELLPVAIPFVLVIIAALATILLWNSGKRNFAYALCAATFLPIVFFIFGLGLGL